MKEKTTLEDIVKIKQYVDHMDLLEFKTQWQSRNDYAQFNHNERLKYLVMSIKILQAQADLKRTINSIKELSTHPESEKALYYYLHADLWKFLDNFHYVVLIEDSQDQDKFECIDLLEDLTEVIAQDNELQHSCVSRLQKLLEQIQVLKQDAAKQNVSSQILQMYQQLRQRVTEIIHELEPATQAEETVSFDIVPEAVRKVIQHYLSFLVSRTSIEKSGVLDIIQLLSDFPLAQLEEHREKLENVLVRLEQQSLYDPRLSSFRNHCGYSLIVLLEILKMHRGLPVLLARIFDLCSYIQFPVAGISIEKELKELKGRVAEISQKKLRPIIEDILWKNPTYLTKLPYIRISCPWCYRKDRENMLNIPYIRQVVTASFDRLESVPGLQFTHEGVAKSHLSEMVIESLGLLVNLEPSPRFLKVHAEETRRIKQTKKFDKPSLEFLEKLYNKQYYTYKNHLKFLEDSLGYYQGLSEEISLPE